MKNECLAIAASAFLCWSTPLSATAAEAGKAETEAAKATEEKPSQEEQTKEKTDLATKAAEQCGGKAGDELAKCVKEIVSDEAGQKKAIEEAAKGLEERCDKSPDKKNCKIEAAKKAKAVEEASTFKGISENFLLQFGVVTLAPFNLTRIDQGTPAKGDDDFRLETNDLSSRFMIEGSGNLRWAWGRGGELDRWERSGGWFFWEHVPEGAWPQLVPDVQLRMGFTFGTDKDDASSAIGSGDMHGELFLGIPLARYMNDGYALSVNFEPGLSLVTNRNAQDIHDNLIVGPSFVGSIPFKRGDGPQRRVLAAWRIGYSQYEVPEFDDTESDMDLVVNENGYPDFESKSGAANIVELHYPLTDSAYASAIGRFYHGSDPNPWSFNVGVSIEIENLAKSLLGLFGGEDKPKNGQASAGG